MRNALHYGRIVQAAKDSPRRAECPACGGEVVLRHNGHGWTYAHITTNSHCPLRSEPSRGELDPEQRLAAETIRRTLIDALGGYGPETLATLFYPLPQAALSLILGTDPSATFKLTLNACKRLAALDDDNRTAAREALSRMSTRKLLAALGASDGNESLITI